MGEPVLYINACVRSDSRTAYLAGKLLEKLGSPYDEVRLTDVSFPLADEAFLMQRDRLIAQRRFTEPMFALAQQFAKAQTIVVAAPYWDLSFPAALKQYFEQINVLGITFKYTEQGTPQGLCRAEKLFYVMTAGGCYVPQEFGFGYVKALAQGFYGISDVRLIKAAGLDIVGADEQAIIAAAESEIACMKVD